MVLAILRIRNLVHNVNIRRLLTTTFRVTVPSTSGIAPVTDPRRTKMPRPLPAVTLPARNEPKVHRATALLPALVGRHVVRVHGLIRHGGPLVEGHAEQVVPVLRCHVWPCGHLGREGARGGRGLFAAEGVAEGGVWGLGFVEVLAAVEGGWARAA